MIHDGTPLLRGCHSGPGPVRCGGPVPVGLVPVGPVPVGPVLVGPVPVGPVPVGPVPVGPVPVGPVLVGLVPVGQNKKTTITSTPSGLASISLQF